MKSSKSLKSQRGFSQQRSSSVRSNNPYFVTQKSQTKMKFKVKNSNLQSQLSDAFLRLKLIQAQIKQETKKYPIKKRQLSIDDLFQMEDNIRSKDREIKRLNAQIKQIKGFRRKQQKTLKQHKKVQQNVYQNNLQIQQNQNQIRLLKKTLESFQNIHNQKQLQFQKKKTKISEHFMRYVENCRKNGQQATTFDQYLQRNTQKQTHSTSSKLSTFSKRAHNLTIKQIIQTAFSGQQLQHTEQNLLELKNRKQILQNSLKTTKRKHQKQLLQLKETFSNLMDENQTLQTKLQQKRRQKDMLQQLKKC